MEWLPTATRVRNLYSEGSDIRIPGAPPRIVIHTVEAPPGVARRVLEQGQYPYHIVGEVDRLDADGKFICYQAISFAKAALSLAHPAGTIETNHMGNCIQISLCTYSAEIGEIPVTVLEAFGRDVIGPIMRAYGIPNEWQETYGPDAGFILATSSSPIRFTESGWASFTGVTYHQRVPYNDHWDAGKLNWRIIQRAVEGFNMPEVPNQGPKVPGLNGVVTDASDAKEINQLNALLNEWFRPAEPLPEKGGKYTNQTEDIVRAAQAILELEVDGYWGPTTARRFITWRRGVADAMAAGLRGPEIDKMTELFRKNYVQCRQLNNAIRDLGKYAARQGDDKLSELVSVVRHEAEDVTATRKATVSFFKKAVSDA